MPTPTPAKWQPVMSIAQLKPGTVLRERGRLNKVLPPQTILDRSRTLIRYQDGTQTSVTAAKRYLEFQAA